MSLWSVLSSWKTWILLYYQWMSSQYTPSYPLKKIFINVLTPVLLNTIKELEQISDLWFPATKAIVTLHYGITFLHASTKSIPYYTIEFVRPVKKIRCISWPFLKLFSEAAVMFASFHSSAPWSKLSNRSHTLVIISVNLVTKAVSSLNSSACWCDWSLLVMVK